MPEFFRTIQIFWKLSEKLEQNAKIIAIYELSIIDTDHASLFLAGNQSIIAQVAKHSNTVAITVITVQELFNGWIGRLNNPTQANNLTHLYTKLWETTEFFKAIAILNFDQDAENICQILQHSSNALAKKRIQKDL